ncbi:sensor domain-containing protein [Alkaliphilus transvaalensis]|uniref:sensor domain-containing protein n=1 Tax=Alkaliphilus transvaalensis TaxID=114628 RepID=UPI0006864187|nr:EAL domain-containing protein [Alkaliphilus transvaalensis]
MITKKNIIRNEALGIQEKTIEEDGIKEFLDIIFETTHDIIVLSDPRGRVVECNKQLEEITGYKDEEIIGTKWINYFDEDFNVEETSISRIVNKFGQEIEIQWKHKLLYYKNGGVKGILSVGQDVTYLNTIEKKLHYMTYYSPLTDMPNRTYFEVQTNRIIQEKKSKEKLILLYIDIDNIKYLNDTFGHFSGNKLLQYVSNVLKGQIKKPNLIAHLGGDEFAILFNDINKLNNILKIIEDTQKLLKQPLLFNENEIFTSASIGVAIYPDHGTDAVTLLKNAETAMYLSKESEKGSYSFYSKSLENKIVQSTWLTNELRKAIKKEEFVPYYQPLIDLSTGGIIGVEVLLRWKHPIRGWISPEEFIPVAESSGLILDIGKWVFEHACKQKQIWNQKGHSNIKMSINLSNKELRKKELLIDIKQMIEKYALDYTDIQVEITETAAIINLDIAVSILQQLKALGIKIALDDFGKGYSSLNYLKSLPIDIIKLDRSFIKSIQDENEKEEIIHTVIQLGHILNSKIVAEGIETKNQLNFLMKNNCDIGQGYLFSKPLPAEEVELLLVSNKAYIR